ncbi:uncharacterized protein CLAFUR5_05268 [Fulvia fulva]|uniref:Uncharacterized protein n=1 Tax=Passalora fulva TaxID=5499 RepID=A0A9Q8LF18_PASFU|nr:uncharacterized protein CLAFUR5_05268 [Fulvia fulva]KAK4616387.1 hypothetical protein CLAFUR0_10583 [Fulvia fulva]UJO16210.1 hypothetical protein CLAFUR5_05268 [Fulvia fulva]
MAQHRPRSTLIHPAPIFRTTPQLLLSADTVQRPSISASRTTNNSASGRRKVRLDAEHRPSTRKRLAVTGNESSGRRERPIRRRKDDDQDIGRNDSENGFEIIHPYIRTPTAQPADPVEPQRPVWNVKGITGKITTRHGLVKWLVDWESTTVLVGAVNKSADGQLRVLIHDLMWYGIAETLPARPHPETGEERCRVGWKQRWCWTWSLSSALEKMSECIEKYPGAVGDRYLEPRFWQESRKLGPHTLPPETESGPRGDFELEGNHLYPEEGRDYTMPFLTYYLDAVEHLSPSCKRLLNVPIRQRLIFSSDFVLTERGISVWRNVRQLLAYVVGQARDWPCHRCANGRGPLQKCVTEDSEFNGACVNCSIDRQTTSCEWHHNLRQRERTKRQLLLVPRGEGANSVNSNPELDRDPSSESDSDNDRGSISGHFGHDDCSLRDHSPDTPHSSVSGRSHGRSPERLGSSLHASPVPVQPAQSNDESPPPATAMDSIEFDDRQSVLDSKILPKKNLDAKQRWSSRRTEKGRETPSKFDDYRLASALFLNHQSKRAPPQTRTTRASHAKIRTTRSSRTLQQASSQSLPRLRHRILALKSQ